MHIGEATGQRRSSGRAGRREHTRQIVVVGIGNDLRHDDGVGPAVVRMLSRCTLPHVTLAVTDGEPSRLLELWADADVAIVVDAVSADPPRPGRLHHIVVDQPVRDAERRASSDGLGLGDAVELAMVLGRMPKRLVILAVEGADFSVGHGLSTPVMAVLDRVQQMVKDEIEHWRQ